MIKENDSILKIEELLEKNFKKSGNIKDFYKNKYLFYVYSTDVKDVNKKFLFLLENPAKFSDKGCLAGEKGELKGAKNSKEFIGVCKEYFKIWVDNNPVFNDISREYGPLLDEKDYAITDANKLRYGEMTKRLYNKFDKKEVKILMKEILKKEIKAIKPKVIFAMGNTAKDYLLEIFDRDNAGLTEGICSVHGELFVAHFDGNPIYVMPLLHPSGKTNYPRDAYTCYMNEGIKNLEKELQIKLIGVRENYDKSNPL